jgi:hypothetical protein
MSTAAPLQTVAAKPQRSAGANLLVQRKCACGGKTSSLTGECEGCGKKKLGLQTKPRVNEPGDVYEQEADRVAAQVLATPSLAHVSSAPPRIQRVTGAAIGQTHAAPASVDRVLASPGSPLEPALRQDMEQRFGHDFSEVRIHCNGPAEQSAREIDANAYTVGRRIVFGAGRFAPGTHQGRRLIAHELTHTLQQRDGASELAGRAGIVQREESTFTPIPEPEELFNAYFAEMYTERFDGIADRLLLAFRVHSNPVGYLQKVFEAANHQISQFEDSLAAAFVRRLTEDDLDKLASSYHGRYALSLIYVAMITGSVTDFERAQAARVLFAKTRQYSPDTFAQMSRFRGKGIPTRIFPVRFMRVTGGDYAPPLAKLLDNGQVRVSYPQSLSTMSTFKNELRTIVNFVGGEGDLINANEIVIIKDYERGTETPLPALALIDYSNQAIHSTTGKILEVSIFAATLGYGSAAVGGAEATAENAAARITSTAIWGARIAKTVRVLDVAANVIGVAAFVIDENREWIVRKLGPTGELLVRISDIANTAVAIYGMAHLAHAGFAIAKDLHAAVSSARTAAKDLTNAEASIIDELDSKLTQLSNEIDQEAATTSRNASAKQEHTEDVHADGGESARLGTDATAKLPKQSAADLDEIHASAMAHKIPQKELEHQADTLARKAGDPDNVHIPETGKVDAEMRADGHRFERNQRSRTWCRYTKADCELGLGQQVNANVDAAVAKKRARRNARPSTKRPPVKNLVPEPYPLLPRGLGSYSNDELLDFFRRNRGQYPEEIQQMIGNVPVTGRVKTAQRKQLEAIDAAIRDLHTQDANRRVVGASAKKPFVQSKRSARNEGELFNAVLTGNKRLNLTGETKSGELVEFDSVRLAEHRTLETKMNLSPYTTSGDVMDQMRRQATFAEDWGFSEVRWEVYDYESYLTARYAHQELSELNPKLGSRIDVVNPSDAHR